MKVCKICSKKLSRTNKILLCGSCFQSEKTRNKIKRKLCKICNKELALGNKSGFCKVHLDEYRRSTIPCSRCKKPISIKTSSGFCRTCYAAFHRELNPNIYKEARDNYYNKNSAEINKRLSKIRKEDPERIRRRDRLWRDTNIETCRAREKEHWDKKGRATRRKRWNSDIEFRLKERLRGRLREALSDSKRKIGSAVKDLGCTVGKLRKHIEKQFKEGMTWDNWGQGEGHWQIDHIVPLASFDLTDREQFKKACHYMNLQPLWEKENKRKGSRMDWNNE